MRHTQQLNRIWETEFALHLERSLEHYWNVPSVFLAQDILRKQNNVEGSTHALPPCLRTRVLVIKNNTHPLRKIIFGYVRYMVYFLQMLNAHQMLWAELKNDVPVPTTYRDLKILECRKGITFLNMIRCMLRLIQSDISPYKILVIFFTQNYKSLK